MQDHLTMTDQIIGMDTEGGPGATDTIKFSCV